MIQANGIDLNSGSILLRKDVHVGLVDHYGVYVGGPQDLVLHIDKSEAGLLRQKVETFQGFAAGLDVKAEPVPVPVPLPAIQARVHEIETSSRPYSLLQVGEGWNCESYARCVQTGVAHSTQVEAAKVAVAVMAIFFGAAALIWVAGSLIVEQFRKAGVPKTA